MAIMELDIVNTLYLPHIRNKIASGKIKTCKSVIDIPPEFADTKMYNATLGHKVNHDFEPNSIYTPYDSAR